MNVSSHPTGSSRLLPIESILKLLPAIFEGWPFCQPSRPPTADEVSRVETRLGVKLPTLLLEVANSHPSYGYWFNSIGNDYRGLNHILGVNADFRERGVPDRYVVFAQGFDGECDAWDLGEPCSGGERPIVYFHFSDDNELTDLTRRFNTFHEFMDALCRHAAPLCLLNELRRAALQLLYEADKTRP